VLNKSGTLEAEVRYTTECFFNDFLKCNTTLNLSSQDQFLVVCTFGEIDFGCFMRIL